MDRVTVTALVLAHLAASLWHMEAHGTLRIDLPLPKDVFVYGVIGLGPVVGAALVWTRRAALGLALFTAAMLGAVIFGVYHHYVLVSPDNIHHLPEGAPHVHRAFVDSAAALALLELASVAYGCFALGRWPGRSRASGPRP